LLVWDEIHKITPLSAQALTNNYVRWILGLTATVPDPKRDPEKVAIINTYCPVVFVYTLDQGVADGVVADYHLFVIMDSLDNITANIQGGTKAKPFMTTEAKQYNYLDNVAKRTMAMAPGPKKADATKFAILRRMRFIYNLPSKTKLAATLLSKLPDTLRIITFCGSIKQSQELFGENVYNSENKKPNMLDAFKKMLINRIGVVDAVNEGHNIPGLDIGIIVQTNSNERSLIQRMGRVVRFREGHKAILFVLCTQGTQDEHWVRKATSDLDSTKITYLHSREIYSGNFIQFLPENMLKKS
jgi:superfamily II DNA or RNA helicase